MIMIIQVESSRTTVDQVQSVQTRRSLFLGRFWTKIQSDNCFETVSTPGLLLEGWHCCSSNFVYNFSKTPWFPLMWMVRFVTFVHKDLFPDKYLWSSTWEIHLKILQPTPWEPVSIVEVVNKSENERKTSSPQHSRCSYASGELIRINFHPKTAEKMAPHCMARLDLVNCSNLQFPTGGKGQGVF